MINSIVHIQLYRSPGSAFDNPLRQRMHEAAPEATLFDFDNYSEESTRQYALDLIRQSRKTAILVEVQAPDAPYTGLVQFFNRLNQMKHTHLLILQLGALPEQLEKMLRLTGGSTNYRLLQQADEVAPLLKEFFHTP